MFGREIKKASNRPNGLSKGSSLFSLFNIQLNRAMGVREPRKDPRPSRVTRTICVNIASLTLCGRKDGTLAAAGGSNPQQVRSHSSLEAKKKQKRRRF